MSRPSRASRELAGLGTTLNDPGSVVSRPRGRMGPRRMTVALISAPNGPPAIGPACDRLLVPRCGRSVGAIRIPGVSRDLGWPLRLILPVCRTRMRRCFLSLSVYEFQFTSCARFGLLYFFGTAKAPPVFFYNVEGACLAWNAGYLGGRSRNATSLRRFLYPEGALCVISKRPRCLLSPASCFCIHENDRLFSRHAACSAVFVATGMTTRFSARLFTCS